MEAFKLNFKMSYLGGQNQRQREKHEGHQDYEEIFPAGQDRLPAESHGAGASPVLNGLESAAWSLYKHQGILTIDLRRLGVVFGTVIGERRKRTKKGGDSRRVSEQELSQENLSER